MIIISGASSGIGQYLLKNFIKKNEIVSGTYNNTLPENALLDYYYKIDITNYDKVIKWISSIKPKLENIVLLNCAGINYNSFAHKADKKKWENVIDVNLIGTFNVIRAILPIMREKQYGRIINFSSVVPQIGVPGTSAYAASKAGLWGLSKSIAAENAKKGITINNLNLGYFEIGMIEEIPEKFKDIIKQKIPTGNFGNPENIFKAVKFFIETDYINGTSIDLNAGLY